MILIADGGASKTSWCLLNKNSPNALTITEGYNPYFVSTDYIVQSIQKSFPNHTINSSIKQVCFYGSGCFPQIASVVHDAISKVFVNAEVSVELDLLGAARALLGNQPGFAAILGTGTNSCIYDGNKIIQNIDSLGFILGDEGSGTAMGKKLLGDYIREYMPGEIRQLFENEYQLDKEKIFRQVYDNDFPNRFCASFTTFIAANVDSSYINELVTDSFRSFFGNLVSRYHDYNKYTFNCVGSIGFVFAKQLLEVAIEYGMKPGIIVKSPIDGLVSYHRRQ